MSNVEQAKGIYISKQHGSLYLKTALLQIDKPCEGKVLAQFDDVSTGKGHGWYEFHAEDFVLLGAMTFMYAIRHIPTGKYMPATMTRSGSGGWSNWIPTDGPIPDGWGGAAGCDTNPRLFYKKTSAQGALTQWLKGVHKLEYPSGQSMFSENFDDSPELIIVEPPIPRVKSDMEIITLTVCGFK